MTKIPRNGRAATRAARTAAQDRAATARRRLADLPGPDPLVGTATDATFDPFAGLADTPTESEED